MLPDFNRLKVFYYIYREGGVVGAAKRLHVTQSAVSQHLQKLEAELKVRLFTRLHKRLVPTAAGEQLFQSLKPFVEDLDRVLRRIHQARSGPSGTLRIGGPVEFGEKYLPGICAGFRQLHPQVAFHLELGHPTVLLPEIRNGKLDFAFADIFSDRSAFSRDLAVFSIETMAEEALILAGSTDYYGMYLNGDHSADRLEGCSFIAYQHRSPAVRSWFRHHFGRKAGRLEIAMTVESVRAVISGLKEGMGLGIVPAHAVRSEIENGELIHIRTGKQEMVNRISLVQLQDKIPGPAEKIFLHYFAERMRELMPGLLSGTLRTHS